MPLWAYTRWSARSGSCHGVGVPTPLACDELRECVAIVLPIRQLIGSYPAMIPPRAISLCPSLGHCGCGAQAPPGVTLQRWRPHLFGRTRARPTAGRGLFVPQQFRDVRLDFDDTEKCRTGVRISVHERCVAAGCG